MNKLEAIAKEMKGLQEETAKSLEPLKKLCEAKAGDGTQAAITIEQLNSVIQSVYGSINYIDSRISRIWDAIYEHQSGHLPKINSPAEMKKAIKGLGLDESYNVEKRTIYASEDKSTFLVDLTIKK